MKRRPAWRRYLLFTGLMSLAMTSPAQVQTIPLLGVRQGPMSGVGIPMADGFIDYLTMLNQRDGGINGMRLSWEECETFFDAGRTLDCYEFQKNRAGGNLLVALPFSTEQFHALLAPTERDQVPVISMSAGRADASDGRAFPFAFTVPINYWSQNTAKIAFIGQRLGGMDKLRGLKLVNVYHDSEFGRETQMVLNRQAEQYGFSIQHIPVTPSGENLHEVWAQVKASAADWVILRGTAAITGPALREAQTVGFPREKIVGTHTTCSAQAMQAAGPAAIGFTCAAWHGAGRDIPVVQDILKHVHGRGMGAGPEDTVGTANWMRGVVRAVIVTEGMRTAMNQFGAKPLTGSQLKWGLEHLRLTAESLQALGAQGLFAPVTLTYRDHEGGGGVKFQRWDGLRWVIETDWIASNRDLVRPLVEASAQPDRAKSTDHPVGSGFSDCKDCPRMIVVPAGSFQMGSTPREQDWAEQQGRKRDMLDRESPRHQRTVSKPFAVGVYEVTRDQFFAFVKDTGRQPGERCSTLEQTQGKYVREERAGRDWRNSGLPQTGDHPVGCVTWNDATDFAAWLSSKTGQHYRLLSEAEWEYVARAGTETYAYWGDDVTGPRSCRFANLADSTPFPNGETWPAKLSCRDGYWGTSPVGKFLPNAFGVYDMLGNVWEWVADCAHPNYQGAPVVSGVWATPSQCDARILRGGAFYENGASIRAAVRGKGTPQERYDNMGFRVARDL